MKNTKCVVQEDIKLNSGKIPYVTAASNNNGGNDAIFNSRVKKIFVKKIFLGIFDFYEKNQRGFFLSSRKKQCS